MAQLDPDEKHKSESKRQIMNKDETDEENALHDPVSILDLVGIPIKSLFHFHSSPCSLKYKYSSTYDKVLLCIGVLMTLLTSLNWPRKF